ncbi:NADH-quinone oxidoreductase subunit NuoK [Archangium primigenium]|uniref:NADH-quinone oxidoreductase subunit NuoK n=1 Tax=[Archangium] primigenium TaxID=2792470 RepID=UPI001959925D|nr:NADH-quinone oxidoreductase subunit NuoK [Archangium primigenium]MBM7118991.1 NADH-quinone oxidoreductase subunit NuoK [Archangium primigenium]
MANSVDIKYYLILAAVLFCLGMFGVLVRRNALVVFMCVELMLNAANLTFLAFAKQHGNVTGHVSAFFVIAVAAAEASIGLAIVIAVFRSRGTVNIEDIRTMKH